MSDPSAWKKKRVTLRRRDLPGWAVDPDAALELSLLSQEEEIPPPSQFIQLARKADTVDSMLDKIAQEMSYFGPHVSSKAMRKIIEDQLNAATLDGVVDPIDLYTAVLSEYRTLFPPKDWYALRQDLTDDGFWEVDWDMPSDEAEPTEYDASTVYDDDTEDFTPGALWDDATDEEGGIFL